MTYLKTPSSSFEWSFNIKQLQTNQKIYILIFIEKTTNIPFILNNNAIPR